MKVRNFSLSFILFSFAKYYKTQTQETTQMLQKLFGFDPAKTTVRTEIMSGLTTFMTMAYILAVNPNILSDAGMDKGALFTTTALISGAATLLMALYAKLPYALAPGMGLNAFYAYTVCLIMGYTWQFAITAVFIEGITFILLTASNLRDKMVMALPDTVKRAISAGIGIYIAFIGMQQAKIVVNSDATLVTLGDITQGPALLAFIGLIITSVLLIFRVKGALMFGILATTIIGIPMGITQYQGIFNLPPSVEPIFFKFEWDKIFTFDMVIVVFTFLFVDLFDTIGTLLGVSQDSDIIDNKDPKGLKKAFMVDAIGTTAGAIMGTSTVTTLVESAAGVKEGGRSGLTAFTTAICFFIALLLSPIFLAIPPSATAPVLVLVGLMMTAAVVKIDFNDYLEAVPAFVCIVFMPLTYSISEGIIWGHISYVLLCLLTGHYKRLRLGMYILAVFFLTKYLM